MTTPGQGVRAVGPNFMDMLGQMSPIALQDARDQKDSISGHSIFNPVVQKLGQRLTSDFGRRGPYGGSFSNGFPGLVRCVRVMHIGSGAGQSHLT
jgi:hypothetical protein